MTSTEQYFMVPETGSVYSITELRELEREGYPCDLSGMCEVYPRVKNPDDYCCEDWTDDPDEEDQD